MLFSLHVEGTYNKVTLKSKSLMDAVGILKIDIVFIIDSVRV